MVLFWDVLRSYELKFNIKEFRRSFPVLCCYLIPVSFGMMLGWPSLAYPYLLNTNPSSPIPITLDQTSLIAGFLMEGNSLGTLFSTITFLTPKSAIFGCFCLQFFGWCVMFGANDIFGLLIARSSVGFANGFGLGQIRRYVFDNFDDETAKKYLRWLNIGVNLGVLFVYSFGGWVSFRVMALGGLVIPFLGCLSFGLSAVGKNNNVQKIKINKNFGSVPISIISKDFDSISGQNEVNTQLNLKPDQIEHDNVFKCLKNKNTRNSLILLLLIIFTQQYTGGPANIVYSQIIFTATQNPHPKICSVIYAIFFLIFTIISTKLVNTVPRKPNLLISCTATAITLTLMSLYFHLKPQLFEINENFVWAPLFILILFNFFHTLGLGTLPFTIIEEKTPKSGKRVARKFQVIHFSMSAVISTKIFQVLFDRFDMVIAYAFFVAVAVFGLICTLIFMNNYEPGEELKRLEEDEVKERQNKMNEMENKIDRQSKLNESQNKINGSQNKINGSQKKDKEVEIEEIIIEKMEISRL